MKKNEMTLTTNKNFTPPPKKILQQKMDMDKTKKNCLRWLIILVVNKRIWRRSVIFA